jgi:hypothetical protein
VCTFRLFLQEQIKGIIIIKQQPAVMDAKPASQFPGHRVDCPCRLL